MLKFFRNIRRRLLESGKVKNYTLYAIGEILLVVIGILIALQVNNWNEARKSKNEKKIHIRQLQAALGTDNVHLQEFESRLFEVDDLGMYLWYFLTDSLEEVDTLKLKSCLLNAGNGFAFSPNSVVYDDLVNSGKINLFESNKLKEKLGSYYNKSSNDMQLEAQRLKYSESYRDERFNHINPLMLRTHLKQVFAEEKFVTPTESLKAYQVDWEKLKRDETFRIILGRMIAIKEPQFNEIKRTNLLIQDILTLLKEEIKTR